MQKLARNKVANVSVARRAAHGDAALILRVPWLGRETPPGLLVNARTRTHHVSRVADIELATTLEE